MKRMEKFILQPWNEIIFFEAGRSSFYIYKGGGISGMEAGELYKVSKTKLYRDLLDNYGRYITEQFFEYYDQVEKK